MKIRKNILTILLTIVIILVGFVALSYTLARRAVAGIFAPAPKHLVYYYGTRFLPLGFKGQADGPSWYVQYDPDALVLAPYGVQVDMFGNVLRMSPSNLLEIVELMVEQSPGPYPSRDTHGLPVNGQE
jgi:hypothetical protein